MKVENKAKLLSASVVGVQGYAVLGMHFLDVKCLGQLLAHALFIGTFLFTGRDTIRLLKSSFGPVYSAPHPMAIISSSLFLGGIVLMWFMTGGPGAVYPARFFGVIVALLFSIAVIGCDTSDFLGEGRRKRQELLPARAQLLFMLGGPQVAIGFVAIIALIFGF